MQIVKKTYDPNLDPKLILIESNYLELLTDDDPMLYVGTSYYGNRIIGSIIEDIYGERILRYFHVIVTDKLSTSFLNGEISLRQIFNEVGSVFVVDFNYDGSLKGIYTVRVDNVNSEWLPLEDSYCPEFARPLTLKFSTSLKGGIADRNIATPKDAIALYDFTSSAVSNALNSLSGLNYELETYYEPAKAGSYKLDFQLNVKDSGGKQTALTSEDIDVSVISSYLAKFIDIAFNKLPSDKGHNKVEEIDSYSDLVNSLESVYTNDYAKVNDKIKDKLRTSVIKVIKKTESLSEAFGKGFNLIEFKGYDDDDKEYSLATLEKNYYNKVSRFIPDEVTIEDEAEKLFKIRVYDINTDSLNCKAYAFYEDVNGKEKMGKVTIKHGLDYLDHSIYSKSLNEKITVDIKGLGRYNKKKDLKIIEVSED